MAGRVPAGGVRRLVLILVGALLAAGLQPVEVARADEPAAAAGALAVTGTPRVGSTVSVEDPDPAATHQWFRGGRPIPDATGTEYTPVAADAGQPLWARASVSVPDGDPVVSRSILLLIQPDWEQQVVAWDSDGLDPAVAALTDVVAVAAGGDHSLALRADGSVVAWGDNEYGQLDVPPGLRDVVAISAGNRFSVALRADGTVVAWGAPNNGRTSPPAGLDQVVAIACGQSHTLALRADGTVAAWGFGTTPPFTQVQVPDGLDGVVAVAAGANHSLALNADGTVVGWGYDYSGAATPPAGLSDVVAVDGASEASIALHSDGTMTEWGFTSPEFPTGAKATAIASNYHRTLALRPDGTVIGWPYLSYGETEVPGQLQTATAVATNDHASLALARVWTDTPAVTGAAQLGRTLTADPGDWVPGATLTYQWLRDGDEVPDATEPAYPLTADDLGARLSLRVTGELAGTPLGTRTSAPSGPVAPGTFDAAKPQISGVVASGRVLTASAGSWMPKPRFSYQWLRNGKAIKGATAARYRLTGKDVGARISVKVTGKLDHYTTRSATSAATAKVMKAGVPTISGTRATGSTLKVDRGSWTAKTRFGYRWLRDGKPIKGATSTRYRLTSADAGHRISVAVTGRRSGYATITVTSAQTTRVLKVATPRIKGIRGVGRLLRAEPGAWTSGTRFTYRWYADGRLVQSSSSPYLWATSAMRGDRIRVTVTGRRSGYATIARSSALAGPIR